MSRIDAISYARWTVTGLVALALAACARPHDLPRPPKPPLPPEPIAGIRLQAPPAPQPTTPGSLYTERAGLFSDLRARKVGDLLTVMIDIDDEAQLDNETSRSRSGESSLGVTGLFGLTGILDRALDDSFDPANAVGINGASDARGEGAIARRETINLKVAVVVRERLPNGNLVVSGRQQIGVNGEVRELLVGGVVRPTDIGPTNTVDYENIAEARLSYGGAGMITTVQQPRWGQKTYDAIAPY